MPAYGNSPLSHSHVYQQVGTWWLFSVFCLCVFVPRLQLGLLFDVSGVFAYLSLVFSPYFCPFFVSQLGGNSLTITYVNTVGF